MVTRALGHLGVEQMGSNFFAKSAQSSKKCQQVPMTFGPFSMSGTNEPNIITKTLIAPRSGASGIAIVIFGSFVADFENGPNVIGTFWHFLKLWALFAKKFGPI